MLDKSRWRACLLPDNCQRKLRQDLAEADVAADSATRLEPEPEEKPQHDNDE